MFTKLQINRSLATADEIDHVWRSLPHEGRLRQKTDAIRGLYFSLDEGITRFVYADLHGTTTRTLGRWINEFNTKGLLAVQESGQTRPGRKRKVDRKDFRLRILPEAERFAVSAGAVTLKALFRAAQSLDFEASYATFRRCLGGLCADYRRRRTQPTLHEWLIYTQTGRWPQRLKAFGRRQARKAQLYWQRYRESQRQDMTAAATGQ
jgi:hypothetical protein